MTTVAAAQSVQFQPGHKPGQENTAPTAPDLTLGVAEFFAVVLANGTLVRGGGAVSSQRLNPGRYEVVFTRNVRNCAYVGSIADAGFTAVPLSGQIGVTGRDTVEAGVFIITYDSSGAPADRQFMLKVSCVR